MRRLHMCVLDLIRVVLFPDVMPVCEPLLLTRDFAISLGPEPVPRLWELGWTVRVWKRVQGVPVLIYEPPQPKTKTK
jgi:hypothetical protein